MNARTKLLIAALAALGAVSQYAQAEALPYKDIKLCKGVTLQNDSAKQWGCWTQFAPPAAGPNAVGYLGQPGSEPYLPPVNPTQPTQPSASSCAAGSLCGYAAYMNQTGTVITQPYAPAYITLTPSSGTPLTLSFLLQQFNPLDTAPNFTGAESWLLGMNVSYNSITGSGSATAGTPLVNNAKIAGQYFSTGEYAVGASAKSLQIVEYINGASGNKITGVYVAGIPTSASDLANQVVNNVSATYFGRELISGAYMNVNVNFGQGTWSGSWNSTSKLPAWGASGTVAGGIIQSNAITGAYNAGQVQGTFYGAGAQALGGVADVHNLTMRHVDVFVATKGVPE